MKTMSLAMAKAHISELVDQAEHHNARVILLRHGKPAAAIVPVNVAQPKVPRAKPQSEAQIRKSVMAYIEAFSRTESDESAVTDLIQGRR
jgi:prevent-host-death family protein